MKTAYETYLESLNENLPTKTHEECIIIAMKLYSNNKIDICADLAYDAIQYGSHSEREIEHEILSLKDKI